MKKQSRSTSVMQTVLHEVEQQLRREDERYLRVPEVCRATGVNYGSVYHHFGSRDGLIDAAYAEMFTKTVASDVELIREAIRKSTSFGAFLIAIERLLNTATSGDERRINRATRMRILAASATRPMLREVIGRAQAEITKELAETIKICQRRGWMRSDFDPKSVAVFVQVVIFGRNLDDLSIEAMPESEWAAFMYQVFGLLLTPS